MCAKNCCTSATRHTIIFFFILSFLLLPNVFNFNFDGPKSASSNKSQPAKGKGSSRDVITSSASSCSCSDTTPMASLATAFLYGALFAALFSITFIASASCRPSSSSMPSPDKLNMNDVIPDSRHHYPAEGPNFLALMGPAVDTDGERGGGRGIEYACLRTLPTFAYSKRRGARMGRGESACVICQSQLRDDQMVRWLPDCDHLFHLACIDQWLAANSTCPCCRADVNCPYAYMNNIDDADNFHYDQHVYGFPI